MFKASVRVFKPGDNTSTTVGGTVTGNNKSADMREVSDLMGCNYRNDPKDQEGGFGKQLKKD